VDHTKELKHISLCTGYGGIDLGLSRALGAFRTIAYVEIEAFALENLVSKIENELLDVAPIWTNLKTFPWKLYRGKVDILSGGFPCQPFSSAGRRAGDEDPRHLFPYIINGLRELGRPPLVFFENVEGILSSKLKSDGWNDAEGTSVLLHVLRELERLGYDATAGVFSACEVGAPHQRKRVFILGVRSDLGKSGRNLVSSMLRDTESRRTAVEHAESFKNACRETRIYGNKSAEAREKNTSLSCNRGTSTAYPKNRAMGYTATQNGSRGRNKDDGSREKVWGSSKNVFLSSDSSSTSYPAPRGAEQYPYEPPRITASDINTARQTQSPLGRDVDGFTDRMDYAELCPSVDSNTDELRLLGNGVVPDTAERAFRVLWRDLSGEEQR